jgi:transposase
MKPFPVTSFHFVAVWQLSKSVRTVAKALSRPVVQVRVWERRLRREGVNLKMMPRPSLPNRIANDYTAGPSTGLFGNN